MYTFYRPRFTTSQECVTSLTILGKTPMIKSQANEILSYTIIYINTTFISSKLNINQNRIPDSFPIICTYISVFPFNEPPFIVES